MPAPSLRYALFFWPLLLAGQSSIPLILGRANTLLPPAVDAAGRRVLFGAALSPEGVTSPAADVYAVMSDGTALIRLTRLNGNTPPQGANAVSATPDAARAVFTALAPNRFGSEEIHVLDTAAGADKIIAVDTAGCIQPLCPICFLPCLQSPHFTPDGAKVLYAARRQQPFYLVNSDGAGMTRLPVFSGALAPAPQRVISRSGQVVFTSNAPAGPAAASSPTDVYLMALDGSGVAPVTRFNNSSLFASNATISASGDVIAFESNLDPAAGAPAPVTQIWVIHTDGSGLRALTSGSDPALSPSISGDGKLVAFTRRGQIFLARSDGTSVRALTNFQMSWAQDPVISEDGSRVIFTIGPQSGGRGAIYSVHTGGGNLQAVYAPRSLNQNGVAALTGFAAPSPGSLITAYGTNLGPDAVITAGRFPLPASLAGISLLVNGRAVPLLSVTPWQVNAQLPPDLQQGPAAFQFRFDDGAMPAAGAADVSTFAPAIFSAHAASECQAAVLHGGTATLADQAHPAAGGETVEIFSLGLGPTNPVVPAGMPAPADPLAATITPPEVTIGGRPAPVAFAGLAPGFAGVYQVNALVPPGLKPGVQSIALRAASASSLGCSVIWVQ